MKKVVTSMMVVGLLTLAGCATTQQRNPEMTNLEMRVGQLEQQVHQKDSQIQSLEDEVKTLSYEVDKLRTQAKEQKVQKSAEASEDKNNIIRVQAAVDQVQTALKNSGHYQGKIDGKAGAQTQTAISAFQQDKGLKVDGVVGQQTWDKLQKYL